MPATSPAGTGATDVDIIPLLPQGIPIFENIPSKAVILEALAPALQSGIMIVRAQGAVGVIIVLDSALHDMYCFSGGHRFLGEVALKRIKGLNDAVVTASKLAPDVLEVIPSLLRGEICYDDLRMSWTNWPKLLADILGRDGTYVIEIFSPKGRGVTCIVDGHQVATYTDAHPQLGETTLVDALFGGEGGSIRIRKAVPIEDTQVVLPPPHATTGGSEQEPDDAGDEVPQPSPAAPETDDAGSSFDSLFSLPDLDGSDDAVDDPGESAGVPAPASAPSLAAHLAELKAIARQHLQRSAARVESILDDGAASNRPLDDVLNDIRALTIRGVMRSTLEEVADAMEKAAES